MRTLILSALFAALALGLLGRPRILRQQALDDLDTLCTSIRELHPDMFAVYPRKLFDLRLTSLRTSLPDSLYPEELFRRAAPLIASLGDGHTSLNLSLGPLIPEMALLPVSFEIRAADTTLHVRRDLSGSEPPIPTGACIGKINGRDVREMLLEMVQAMSGEKPFGRFQTLEDGFNFFLYAYYPARSYTLEYSIGDSTGIARPGTVSFGAFRRLGIAEAVESRAAYDFRELPDRVGLMEFNECSDLPRFCRFLDSVFTVVANRRIGDLIIDVRYNSGGDSQLADSLFAYISPGPYTQVGKGMTRISDRLKRFRPGEKRSNGIHRFRVRKKGLTSVTDGPLHYRGRAFVLTSHRTFSAAADLAGTFQYFGMGKVIGEETAGMNISFGDAISFDLPNSGLRVNVSYKKFYMYGAHGRSIHGVQPDYEVPAAKALEYTLKNLTGK